MIINTLKVVGGRNFINGQPLAHIVWNHYHPDDPWTPGHAIHHIDEDTLNDWHENLDKLTRGGHVKLHRTGKKWRPEDILKMSLSSTGKKHSDETKKKIGLGSLGRKHSEETCKKLSEINKGKIFSKEHIENMSKSHKGLLVGNKNPNYGKPRSEETKRKISIAHKNLKNSRERNELGRYI